jgi:hypothetical protein
MADMVKRTTKSARLNPSLVLVVLSALASALVLGGSGCSGATESTIQNTTLGISTETTQAEPTTVVPESTGTTESPLVGLYSGDYRYDEPDIAGTYPVDFEVKPDGSIEGIGEIYDGTAFEVYGNLGGGNSFVAEGDVKGAGMKVTFSGTFSVSGGVVTVEGTWQGGSGYAGTWTGSKGG